MNTKPLKDIQDLIDGCEYGQISMGECLVKIKDVLFQCSAHPEPTEDTPEIINIEPRLGENIKDTMERAYEMICMGAIYAVFRFNGVKVTLHVEPTGDRMAALEAVERLTRYCDSDYFNDDITIIKKFLTTAPVTEKGE